MDIPGFGDAASLDGYTVKDMTRQIAETIGALQLKDFVLVGHSMSGKPALALAAENVFRIRGLILVAPSPPSPEPIPDSDRRNMLALERCGTDAEIFLDGITAKPLEGDVRRRAVEDFVRCSPNAWTAWLEHGSKEDWSRQIGVVERPTLIVTGDADKTLHDSVQRHLTLPHLKRSRFEIMERCGHLPTMEAPERLSIVISGFVNGLPQ